MVDSTPVNFQVNCVHCGRPVTLQLEDRLSLINIETIWTCPYRDCPTLEGQSLMFPGELLDVWIGHGPAPEPESV